MPATLSRRSFFNLLTPASGGNGKQPSRNGKRQFQPLSDPLQAFVPDANNPWNEYLAGHLLRRTMMAPTWSDIEALVKLGGPGPAVDLLLGATSTPAAPLMASDATENPYPLAQAAQQPIFGKWESDAAALRAWWEGLQVTAANSIQEKMVAFWSGHFTSAFVTGDNEYVLAPLLYIQNNLFRTFGNTQGGSQNGALGNFQDLVKAVTLDGAMLVYLGGNVNVASAPNENYARELMELFTCGINGGYSQADVVAAARILTGWQVGQYTDDAAPNGIFQSYFTPSLHDTGDKTYLETDFPAIDASTNTQHLVQVNEIDILVDTLFTQTSTTFQGVTTNTIATYICTKLYKFFVYSDTDTSDPTEQTVISELAGIFIQNNWEIAPVVSTLLKSQHFFDNANIGCQIKTPAEYVIGLARQIVPADAQKSFAIDADMTNDGEQFFQPPNVSGWPGYHDWLTTNTYPLRTSAQAQVLVSAMSAPDLQKFYQQFPAYNSDVTLLATHIGQLLLPRPLSTARQTTFWQTLAGGTDTTMWLNLVNADPEEAAANTQTLLQAIIALPDFQLC